MFDSREEFERYLSTPQTPVAARVREKKSGLSGWQITALFIAIAVPLFLRKLPDQGPSDPRRIVMRWVFSVAGADPDSLVPTMNARATPALGTSQSASQPIGAPQTNAFVNP